MSYSHWMPLYDENGELQDGPTAIFGYDGRVHPDRATVSQWRAFWMRRARQLGTHTKEEWKFLRNNVGKCVGCGADDVSLAKDHIIPVSRGGCDCIQNIQPLCQPCNSRKGASMEDPPSWVLHG
jgi:5-methylcytosine-specific restriction endonuclease McrA